MAGDDSKAGGVAERYAAALYELADADKALDSVADDLRRLTAMFDESGDLKRLLTSPLIGRSEQSKAMTALLDKAGAGDLTRRFVQVVVRNQRGFALPGMAKAYLAELARRRGEVTAEVTVAQPLGEAQLQTLTETLRAAVGSKVRVETEVDPSLIGGLIVKVGSRMVDSSIKSKLQKLQLAMKGTA